MAEPKQGQLVRITAGPLKGQTGYIQDYHCGGSADCVMLFVGPSAWGHLRKEYSSGGDSGKGTILILPKYLEAIE